MNEAQSFCILDHANRIVSVGGRWDEFARENDGDDCLWHEIAGRSIFRSVTGFKTRCFLNAALSAVRNTGQDFVFDYRCDSECVKRFMRMTVTPLPRDRLLMVHDFLAEERIGSDGVRWLYAHDATSRKCSLCCSVEFGRVWIDPFELDEPHPQFVTYAICPHCERRAAGALGDTDPDWQDSNVIRFHRRSGRD